MLKSFALFICLLLASITGFSQKRSYTAEEMEFLAQVRRTPEYLHLKHEIDSINRDTTQVPQDLSLTITRSLTFSNTDTNFFNATLSRHTSIIRFGLESYRIKYDRNKRKIVLFESTGHAAKIN